MALSLRGGAGRARVLALSAVVALAAFAFIGRAVISADDGADMLSDTLGFLVHGRFESATMPPARADPYLAASPPFHSRYGVFPSLLPLPFLGLVWPFRGQLGAAAVDACASLTWATGAVLAAFAFGRLARALKPDCSPFWVPAFLGGTFLWAYVADSFVEPWAAAGLTFAGAELFSKADRPPWRAALAVAAGGLAAFILRPVAWVVAPVLLLAAILEWRARADGSRRAMWLLGDLAAGIAALAVMNLVDRGSATDFGYGVGGLVPFVHDPWAGLLGYTIHPGRGLLFYAPVALAAVLMARRLPLSARLLCFGGPSRSLW